MADPWRFEPVGTRRWRERRAMELEARRYAAQQLMAEQAQAQGVDLTRTSPTAFDRDEEAEYLREQGEGGGGGMFDTLSKFIGGAADIVRKPSKIGGDVAEAIVSPIDRITGTSIAGDVAGRAGRLSGSALTGPLTLGLEGVSQFGREGIRAGGLALRGMEYESEYLGKPIYRGIVTGIAAPFRVAMRGESFDDAIDNAWKESESLGPGGIVTEAGGIAFSPTTWFGPGALKGIVRAGRFGMSNARLVGRASVAEDSARAMRIELPELMGAADKANLKLGPRTNIANEALVQRLGESLKDPTKAKLGTGIFRTVGGWFQPSVVIPRGVTVGRNAMLAAKSRDEALMWGEYKPVIDNLVQTWDAEAPRYTGPANNKIKGTLRDFLDNPDFYEGASPRLRAQTYKLDRLGDRWVEHARYQRNVDIGIFLPDKHEKGAIYVPNIGAKDDTVTSSAEIASGLHRRARLSGQPSVAKPRFYQTAYERMIEDSEFVPETDLYRLFGIHTQSLARAAGAEAFKTSTGGMNRVQVLDDLVPHLRVGKEALAAKLDNLKSKATRLQSKMERIGVQRKTYESEVRRQYRRAEPIVDSIDDLGEEYGPELSFLSGQWHELKVSLNALHKSASRAMTRNHEAAEQLKVLRKEISQTESQLAKVRNSYQNIHIPEDKFAFNSATNRYYDPETSTAISHILEEGHMGVIGETIDEMRLFVFAADFSPVTIQGFLGAIADIPNAARSGGKMARIFFGDGKAGDRVWQEIVEKEPEVVARFAEAWGRQPGATGIRRVGEVSGEGRKGLERVPLIGGAVKGLNDRLMDMVGVLQYNGWKNDAAWVARAGRKEAGPQSGYVRLYRGLTTKATKGKPAGEFWTPQMENARQYSKTRKVVDGFVEESQGDLFYVDVPKAQLDELAFAKGAKEEVYSLPAELQNKARKVGEEGIAQHVADKDAANVWSRIIPELLQAERGVSAKRAKQERLPFISTSFIASPALAIKDITSAMMKLAYSKKLSPAARWASLSGREQLGLKRYTNMAGTLSTISITSALASAESRGWSPQEAIEQVMDPTSPYFMSIILADKGSIGLGGPFRSFFKGLAGAKTEDGKWVPFGGLLPIVSGATRGGDELLPSFWRGKANPAVSFTMDYLKNEDFLGRPIRGDGPFPTNVLQTMWYAAESFTPVSVGGSMEKFRTGDVSVEGIMSGDTGDISTLGVGLISEFLGQNFRETTEYDELRMTRDDLARQEFAANWEDLSPKQRWDLEQKYPGQLERPAATTEIGMALESRNQILEQYQEAQAQLDANVEPGPEWAESYRRLNISRAAAFQEWERANPEAAQELIQEPVGRDEEALSEYFNAFKEARTPWGDLDNELLSIRLNDLDSKWTSSQKAYIDENTGFKNTPVVKRWKAAQKTLQAYWQITDQVWERMREQYPDHYGKFGTIDEFVNEQVKLMVRRGVDEEQAFVRASQMSIVRSFNETVSKLRLRMRITDPKIQNELALWYGYDSPKQQSSTSFRPGARPAFLKPIGSR